MPEQMDEARAEQLMQKLEAAFIALGSATETNDQAAQQRAMLSIVQTQSAIDAGLAAQKAALKSLLDVGAVVGSGNSAFRSFCRRSSLAAS